MRYVTEPTVTLLSIPAHPSSFPYGFVPGKGVLPGEALPEFAGRLCYLSFGQQVGGEVDGHRTSRGRTGNREYLGNILAARHGSVLEHANYTFLFEGVSRSLTHELVRHRHFSYSQLSQRYVDESDVVFVVPPEILALGKESVAFAEWSFACDHAIRQYRALMARLAVELERSEGETATSFRKRLRGTARSVLPNCTETKIVVTGNLRAWRHFLVLRGGAAADVEIRRLAFLVYDALRRHAPGVVQDFAIVRDELTSEHGSV